MDIKTFSDLDSALDHACKSKGILFHSGECYYVVVCDNITLYGEAVE